MSAAVAIDPPEAEFLTLEEFAEIDFDEVVELVDGKVKFMGNNNPEQSQVLLKLGAPLTHFVDQNELGTVFGGDVMVLV